MQFLILGGLEIHGPGQRMQISAPKQRAVLAGLLLCANNEVPFGQLIRYVWDGRPPATAQTTLQSYIYRLRQLLRPLPGVELRTSIDSYMLAVEPAETDLWSFRTRVEQAREDAARSRWPEAIASLRAAGAVWRGNALTGVPGEVIRQEGRVLDGERIAAYEELYGAEIFVGNTRQIVPELQRAVASYPYHEVFHAQLMLALYASGRQVEALQTFASVRLRLRERLGIDPGPGLQHLHRSILRQLPVEQMTAPGPPRPVPGERDELRVGREPAA
ncbi:BTAD domain-containing putative transcriptional regulator [Dactylosporangium sp. NPDC051541]|uniref:AfsR/SARP family transcriptional regulator n=1 Tax=Dactylosporangium sp. NPDC051541 TaxID=3363977 RepID=UPI0037AD575D